MTRIDFYILNQTNEAARLDFTVKLCEKALNRHNKVVIHTDNQEACEALSERLWQNKAESFLAHEIAEQGSNSGGQIPIIITQNISHTACRDVLINLGASRPDMFSQFDRLIEVAYQQADSLKASRDNYSFFKARGYDLQVHKL